MDLSEVYAWHLEDMEKVETIAILFSEEIGLSMENTEDLFESIVIDNLSSTELLDILYENYESFVTLDFINEVTGTQELLRKQRIEVNRKKLGTQHRELKGDTESQKLNKSVLRLQNFKIDKEGQFKVRSKKGNVEAITTNLIAKRLKFKSTEGKLRADKASKQRQDKSAKTKKVITGKGNKRTSSTVARLAA